jgi:hypothetical protein
MPWQHDTKIAGHLKSIHGRSSKGKCNGFTCIQASGQLLLDGMETLGRGFSPKGV